MGYLQKHGKTMLLPIYQSFYHVVSRHPHSIPANIRPFDALSGYIWVIFVAMTIAMNVIMLFMKCFIEHYDIFQGYANLVVLSGFTLMMFDVLFGVDLRDTLITQDFELKVDSWNDVNFLNTYIKYVTDDTSTGRGFEFANTNLLRQGLTFHLFTLPNWQEHFSPHVVYDLTQIDTLEEYFEYADSTENPHDLVFFMSE